MNFGDGPKGSGGDTSQQEQLLQSLKLQAAIDSAQKMMQNITDQCFKKCISKPGTSLDNSEQKCISFCMDRYSETMAIVAKVFNQKIQQGGH